MKKLMMAVVATIATVGAASAATTFTQKIASVQGGGLPTIYTGTSQGLYSGNIYVIATTTTVSSFADNIKSAYSAGTKGSPFDLGAFVKDNGGDFATISVANGQLQGVTKDASGEYVIDLSFNNINSVNRTIALLEVLNDDGSSKIYVSSYVTATQRISLNNLDLPSTKWTDGFPMVAPTPSPIPEPTSGLLMLIGMAGLALKRKRA